MPAEPSALELIAVVLTAVLRSVPLAVLLAACVIAMPPRAAGSRASQRSAVVIIGVSLLVGILMAGAAIVVLPFATRGLISSVGITLGLLGAMVAAVLVIANRPDGSMPSAALGLVGGVLIGLSEPGQTLPALFGLSQAVPVVLTAMVIEAVLLIAFTVVLTALSRRVGGLRLGVAVGGLTAGLLILVGAGSLLVHEIVHLQLPTPPMLVTLIAVAVAVVIGTVVGSRRGRTAAGHNHAS